LLFVFCLPSISLGSQIVSARVREVRSSNPGPPVLAKSCTELQTVRYCFNIYASSCGCLNAMWRKQMVVPLSQYTFVWRV